MHAFGGYPKTGSYDDLIVVPRRNEETSRSVALPARCVIRIYSFKSRTANSGGERIRRCSAADKKRRIVALRIFNGRSKRTSSRRRLDRPSVLVEHESSREGSDGGTAANGGNFPDRRVAGTVVDGRSRSAGPNSVGGELPETSLT